VLYGVFAGPCAKLVEIKKLVRKHVEWH